MTPRLRLNGSNQKSPHKYKHSIIISLQLKADVPVPDSRECKLWVKTCFLGGGKIGKDSVAAADFSTVYFFSTHIRRESDTQNLSTQAPAIQRMTSKSVC